MKTNLKRIPGFYISGLMILMFSLDAWQANAQIDNINQRPVPAKVNYDQATDSSAGFKGGSKLLFEYIEKEFQLQDTIASVKQISYVTIASFMVDSLGNISQVTLTRPEKQKIIIPEMIQVELVSVLSQMPLWKPGIQNGQAVKSMVLLPLQFTIIDRRIHLATPERTDVPEKKTRLTGEKKILLIGAVVLVIAIAVFAFGGK